MARHSTLAFIFVALFAAELLTRARQHIITFDKHCRYGVFLVKGNYTFNLTIGNEICLAFNYNLATENDVWRAYNAGYETCRNGWVAEGKYVIPRQKPQNTCGKGQVGFIATYSQPNKTYDTYCIRNDEREVINCNKMQHIRKSIVFMPQGVVATDDLSDKSANSSSENDTNATSAEGMLHGEDAGKQHGHPSSVLGLPEAAQQQLKDTSIYTWIAQLLVELCAFAAAIYIAVIVCSRS